MGLESCRDICAQDWRLGRPIKSYGHGVDRQWRKLDGSRLWGYRRSDEGCLGWDAKKRLRIRRGKGRAGRSRFGSARRSGSRDMVKILRGKARMGRRGVNRWASAAPDLRNDRPSPVTEPRHTSPAVKDQDSAKIKHVPNRSMGFISSGRTDRR